MLLGYLARGASAVRLDAIGFLWKESGTPCLHLPQTHAVDQAVAGPGRPRRAGRAAADRDQRPARTRTSPTSATATTRRTSSTSSHCRRWCCTRSWPGSTARLSAWAGRRRAGERDRDLVQLPRQPRRHRAARHRGHPGRRRAGRRWSSAPLARRPGLDGHPAGRHADGVRAQPRLPRRPLHGGPGADPDDRRGQGPRLRTASCSRSSASPPSTTTRSSARHPTSRAWSAAGSTAGSTAPSSMPTGWSASCARTHGAARIFDGLRHLLDVRRGHEAFSPFGTQRVELLDDRVFALRRGEGTADELRCITNVSGDEVRCRASGGSTCYRHACRPAGAGAVAVGLGAPGLESAGLLGVLVARLDRGHRALEPLLEQAPPDGPEQG